MAPAAGSAPPPEATLSVLLAGGAGVGKSSIARRLLVNKFSAVYVPTVGVDMLSALLPSLPGGSRTALMQLWDPSHLELHGAWPEAVRGATTQVVLLVCDPAQPESLRDADEWLLRARCELGLAAGEAWLLAHKADRRGAGSPALGPHQLDAYCAARGLMGWRHTTAKHGRSIHEAFEQVLEAAALGMLGAAPPVPPAPALGPPAAGPPSASAAARLRAVAAQLREAEPKLAGATLAPSLLRNAAAAASAAAVAAAAVADDEGAAAVPQATVGEEEGGLAVLEWEECARLCTQLVGDLVYGDDTEH